MEDATNIIEWSRTLPRGAQVGVDDGGLCLRAVVDGVLTDSWLEIGGIPAEIEEVRFDTEWVADPEEEQSPPATVAATQQLLFNFDEVREVIGRAEQTVKAMSEAEPRMTDLEIAALRKTINRLVGVLAAQSGLDYAAVWVLAYHELHRRTGFHAVVESKGEGTHLDAVAHAGHLPALRDVLLSMLTEGSEQ